MHPGDRLLGHYRLVHRIGSGGMGEVYLAEDTRINRQVAIKVLRSETEPYPDPAKTQETMRLFQREMRAITMLDHPHILPLFDFGEEKDGSSLLTYMVMPYRQEGSLADWLRNRGNSEKLTPNEVAHFVMQAAEALQHAHDHYLVHQDVKPSNFLVRHRPGYTLPDLLLMDFGIAKINTATMTASQNIRGTPTFMAPEQWEGQPQPATDQYALAVMAYLLLTGHPPFSGRMEQVMRQHFMVQPQPTSSLNLVIPPALDAVILHALEKQPDQRFPSILQFAQAFQQALQSSDNQASAIALSKSEQFGSAPPLPTPIVPVFNPDLPVQPPSVIGANISSPNWGMLPPPPPPLEPIVNNTASSTKKSVWQPKVLIALVILVVISSVIGVSVYLNQVNASANAAAASSATAQANDHATATVGTNQTVTARANETATVRAQATATAQAIASNPYSSYIGDGYTLRYPLDWTVTPQPPIIIFTPRNGDQTQAFVINVTAATSNADLDAGLAAGLNSFRNEFENYQQDNSVPPTMSIGGDSWKEAGATGDKSGYHLKAVLLVDQHPANTGKVFVISLVTEARSYDQAYNTIFKPIFDSWRFT
jgi:eukaryotic-like serine/threonine-protein kinase